ncbi:MAG: TolC family outer membrane protein [Pseudomonadota bacterium]
MTEVTLKGGFMRVLLILVLTGCLAACSQNTRGGGSTFTAVAARNTVDLASADGAVFLQSAHTGFMDAGALTVSAPPPQRNRRRWGFGRAHNGHQPEIGDARTSGAIHVAHAATGADHPTRPKAHEKVPHMTIRPRNARTTRSLRGAFEAAYDTNPTLNQARSDVRAADEDVAIARSRNRPTISASVSQSLSSERNFNFPTGNGGSATSTDDRTPATLQLDVRQPLFEGFRTRNLTRQAEATVRAERERLRGTEQDVLLATALSFVELRRFRGGVRFRTMEVSFLREQVDAAAARQEFGEGTRTDIDQARARLAEAQALLANEEAGLAAARAEFERQTNLKPEQVRGDVDIVALIPRTLADALHRGASNSPDIQAAIHDVDAAQFNVKATEGQLLPSLSLDGQVAAAIGEDTASRTEAAEIGLTLTIPIYQGGQVAAQTRQAKEQLGSARIGVDIERNDTRSTVLTNWQTIQTSKSAIVAANASVQAGSSALDGVLEELRVGQRTTIDVLNAQRDLVRAEISKLNAIRDRDQAAYTLLRAIGGLEVHMLALSVQEYDPNAHYAAVKYKWGGLRTPDGR